MAWVYLLMAGLMEIGWPIGLKMASSGNKLLGGALALVCIVLSGGFLMLAQRTIPMGTAYAVWTGIGAAGAFVAGIVLYGDTATAGRLAGVGLIVLGVVTLKLASAH